MKYYLLLIILLFATLSSTANAFYWFQFGARADTSSEFNQGASLSIETLIQHNITSGSPAFWVGETLKNGAFIQAGYLVTTEAGSYPTYCTASLGCTQYENLGAGQAEWFYEYFPSGSSQNFLGGIGPANSAGTNGTFNNYGFYYNGSTWVVLFNNRKIGSVNLGTNSSGVFSPSAFGELANATNGTSTITPVLMSNLSSYQNGQFIKSATGYSYIGYGVGSQKVYSVPFGVQEENSRVNYFEVGSGLPKPANGTMLWSLGYSLKINSQYGNISGTVQQIAYTKSNLVAPRVVYINNNTRAVFAGWTGSGFGAYSGLLNDTTVVLNNNITETANWQVQYYLDVSSTHGITNGTGWYNANSTVRYSINASAIYENSSSRDMFEGWSNGNLSQSNTIRLSVPETIVAKWQHQYFVNATTQYGTISGAGWQAANSVDDLSVYPQYLNSTTSSRLAFYSWSNGAKNRTIQLYLNGPYTLSTSFREQYFYLLSTTDAYGNRLNVTSFYINGEIANNTQWLFQGNTYNITQAYFKGVWLPVNKQITASPGASFSATLPIYNVQIYAQDLFGNPVNASASLKFDNGTTIFTNTDGSGEILLDDVPYGDAVGNLRYSFMTAGVETSRGNAAHIVFLNLLDIVAFAMAIVAAVIVYIFSSKKLKHSGNSILPQQLPESQAPTNPQ